LKTFFTDTLCIQGGRTSQRTRQHHTLAGVDQYRFTLNPIHEPGTLAVFSSGFWSFLYPESEKKHHRPMDETTLARSPTIFYPRLQTSYPDISTGRKLSAV